jgi:hypothetical protein
MTTKRRYAINSFASPLLRYTFTTYRIDETSPIAPIAHGYPAP